MKIFLAYILMAMIVSPIVCRAADQPRYIFGVLIADQKHMVTDKAAGVRLAMVGIKWSSYEPEHGVYDTAYRDQMITEIKAYRAAGFRVGVSVGVHYPPKWITQDPGLQHHSQFPGDTSGLANLVFNQSLRDEAAKYIKDVVTHMGPVDYYRVGLSHFGETTYPQAPHQEWWAFDTMAQGDQPGRPATIPDPPLRHWVPGTSYQGRAVTREEADAWYTWYLNALIDAHDWEIRAHRDAGYQGPIQLPMPGPGVRPDFYRHKMDVGLAPSTARDADPFNTFNSAAVWFLFLDRLKNRDNIIVDISSVYDKSGQPRGNECSAGDDQVDYLHDPQIDHWSSTRWISLQARRNGFPLIGENPGKNNVNDMHSALHLMQSCHLIGLMWAFDYELYNNGTHASINDYAEQIGEYSR